MSNKISRRNFLKHAGIGAIGAAAAGVLTGCGSASSAAAGTYTPGTYTASAQGIGEVKVTMTFDAEKITNVELDVSGETAGYGKDAAEALIKQVLDTQSSEIDGVSGATITSGAVKKAAESCINQAKGIAVEGTSAGKAETVVPDGLTVEQVEASCAELGDITPDETLDYDIVVVGAGAAGVPAAGWAAELGASVALLQKQNIPVSQGGTGSAIIKSKSTPAGLKMWTHMTNGMSSWRSDTKQLDAYVEHSEEALMWVLNRAGLTSETEYGDGSKVDSKVNPEAVLKNEAKGLSSDRNSSSDLTGTWHDRMNTYEFGDEHCYFFGPNLGPKPKNVGDVVAAALETVTDTHSNLEVHYSTPAVKLIKDGDKVVGVIGKTADGKYIQFNASKGVILATGDYQNNAAMVHAWCPDAEALDKKQYQKTGDGHVMAMAAGAKMEPLGHTKMVHDFDSGMLFEEPFLYVNMEGNRFCNEDIGFVYMSNLLKYQPTYAGANMDADHANGSSGWYCEIFDNDYMSYANSPVPMEVVSKYIPGAVEDPKGVLVELLDTYKADTLDELAAFLDVPADALKASVERYNELCDEGSDVDFGKRPQYMHKVMTAPYWGIRKHVRVSAITSGILINENAQALDAAGQPIEGLYCVGNVGGPFYGGADYPIHQNGLSLGRCYTFGMIAAKHALGKL